jgi:hypothetical protein
MSSRGNAMSDLTTQNFYTVLQEFQWPEPVPVTYRLYHDDHGKPLFYSMEQLPGAYIEIDQATYMRASYQVLVKDRRLIVLTPRIQVSKLAPDNDHGVPCDRRDVCVVVSPDRPHQKWKKIANDID